MEQRHNSTLSPSNSMLVPYDHRQLTVAPPITAASRFSIPSGWGVQDVPRHDGSRSDRYYYEPGTGRKFRSTREVDRYLNGEQYGTRRSTRKTSGRWKMLSILDKNYESRRVIVSGGKLFSLDDELDDELSESHLAMVATEKPAPMAPYILPDGWIVEEYYYEPGMGQKFRSLVAVERYLAELEENAPLSKTLEEIKENKPLSKVFKLENHTKKSTQKKKSTSGESTQASSFVSQPTKVNWIIASPQGDAWNPFISEELVLDAVKQQWSNRFMLLMNQGNNDQSS